ncbi:MAG: polysaccharide biosynthesis C-terminal domain-containing protein [Afipia sp.]|nr:polysaccharide biosynthesis C-terminal domain-containing protein [Afipia sp.]
MSITSVKSQALKPIVAALSWISRRDVAQGLAVSILIQASGGLVAFAMFSLAARVLSTVDFGHLAMWLSICQMGSVVAILGQEMFILRSLNQYTVADQPALAKGALLFSVGIVCVVPIFLSIVAGLGFLASGIPLSLVITMGLFLVASSMIALSSHVARSVVGIVIADGMREVLWRSLVVVGLMTIILAGGKIQIERFFLLASAAIGVAICIQIFAIRAKMPANIVHAKADWRIRDWSRMSVGFWVSTILDTINQYLDVVIIYWLLDPVAAGAYFIASRLANMFATILSAVHSYATRRIPSLYFSRKFGELDQMLRSMSEVVLLCVVTGVAIIGFGGDTILGLFGPTFASYKWTLFILTTGTALFALGGPAAAVLLIAGHEARYPWIVGSNMVLRFIGFAILIPMFGLQGAAVSTAASLVIVTIVLNALCRRWVGVDPSVLILVRRSKRTPAATDAAETRSHDI